jgi:hypothetical protein
MWISNHRMLGELAAAVNLESVALRADEPSPAQLQQQIKQLHATVDQLSHA